MGDNLISSVVTVLTAIIGLAVIATLVSKNANTQGVIGTTASGFSQALSVAEAPVTGAGSNSTLDFSPAAMGGAAYVA
jgi:hypothetical protein